MSVVVQRNLLLDSLGSRTLELLSLQSEEHPVGTVLIRAEETPPFVFFPHHNAVVSIIRATQDGSTVEVGVIGSEGFFSVHSVLAEAGPTSSQALVQNSGRFSRAETGSVRECFRIDQSFRDRALEFTSVYLHQVTQNLVCNRLHPIEHRLAKWLLMLRDRIDTDVLFLTQDLVAHMLGIHRPGVSIAIAALEMDGLIEHSRNRITLRDRSGLERRSCECFAITHDRLSQFVSKFGD